MSKLKNYHVSAIMMVPLTCTVRARSDVHAIDLAKFVADDGHMDEHGTCAQIGDWQITFIEENPK